MSKEEILSALKELKPKYEAEGFEILGLFGSYARGEETKGSDVDILIETTQEFLGSYRGFRAFTEPKEIIEELKALCLTKREYPHNVASYSFPNKTN